MFKLSRAVRFAMNPAGLPSPSASIDNGHGGHPAWDGPGCFLTLIPTLSGDLDGASQYLRDIKEIDQVVRAMALPHIAAILREQPARFGSMMMLELFEELRDRWPGSVLEGLALQLSPFLSLNVLASEIPMTRLSQKFEFAASHRLHNPALSAERNRELYGKCNNPHGHGHNYELQVTLVGEPGPEGLLVGIPAFERMVREIILDKFDHKNLNVELEEFQQLIPSVENIAQVIFDLLQPAFNGPAKLAAVTVWETGKTWCEVNGPRKT